MDNGKIKINNLVDYLKHPLQLKAERAFGKNNNDDEKLEQEFEPFDLDNLKQSIICSSIANEVLQKSALDDTTYAIEVKALDSIKRHCALFNVLPRVNDDYVNDPVFNKSFNNCVDLISKLFITFFKLFRHKPSLDNILKMDVEIKINEYIVSIDKGDVLLEINGNKLSFMEIKKIKDNPNLSDFYNLYVISLFYVLLKDNDVLYSIEIIKGDNNKAIKRFDIDSKTARRYLERIVEAVTSQTACYQFIPISKIENELEALDSFDEETGKYKDLSKNPLSSYFDILNEASQGDHTTWKFFIDARLFNNIKNLGYSNIDNFDKEYRVALRKYRELIIPLLQKKKETIEDDVKEEK